MKLNENPIRNRTSRILFSHLLIIGVHLLLCHCKDNQERPELVNSLRALGVEQVPHVATPDESVKLKFILAGPSSMTVTPELQIDKDSRYSLPAELSSTSLSVVETVVGPLSYYTFDAEFSAPSTNLVQSLIAKFGFAKVRYAVKFSSNHGEEFVVGDTLVTGTNSRIPDTMSPEATIDKPDVSAAGNKIELSATIANLTSEKYRLSWFVSTGSVSNRRAVSTFWENPNTGPAAVFLTVRDLKSGFFTFKAKEVLINGD